MASLITNQSKASISEWLFGAPMGSIVTMGIVSVPLGIVALLPQGPWTLDDSDKLFLFYGTMCTLVGLVGDIMAYLHAHHAERRGHWSSRIEEMRIAFRFLLAGPLVVIAAKFFGSYVDAAIYAVPAALGIVGN
ncbi:hypothetical protein FHW79_005379 [Azospirillum sp. OGB3]|uniref:hypothetical protein n=1 Tax=Azospirillum sp. OGB3 TaxID=2587012 RepID=UPI00160680E2|nr:hypothetical protein [Azospirillum sp. OGB3]MBB3267714.1 hypothetical protein [Azospirillum sp. OGB3]